jgi:hypothetical protein
MFGSRDNQLRTRRGHEHHRVTFVVQDRADWSANAAPPSPIARRRTKTNLRSSVWPPNRLTKPLNPNTIN